MGRKMESAIIPYNDYVMELGAHEPPAPPEKELAEMRGMWQTLLAAAIGIFIWFFFLDPNHGWLHWGLNGAPSNESSVETTSPVSTEPVSAETTAPAEGEKGIGFIAFLNKKPDGWKTCWITRLTISLLVIPSRFGAIATLLKSSILSTTFRKYIRLIRHFPAFLLKMVSGLFLCRIIRPGNISICMLRWRT